MKKKCFKCNKIKSLDKFYKHPKMPDGTVNKCKECNKTENNVNRKNRLNYYKNYDLKRYRKNFTRLLKHKYRGMYERVNGIRSIRNSLGKELCSYAEFIDWFNKNKKQFIKLYKKWEKSGFERKLSPSIDRIDSSKGYSIDNIQWLALTDNCKKHNK